VFTANVHVRAHVPDSNVTVQQWFPARAKAIPFTSGSQTVSHDALGGVDLRLGRRQRTGKMYRSENNAEREMHVAVSTMSWQTSTPVSVND
jgi:hypothetical protein